MYRRVLALGLMMILWGGAARAGEPREGTLPTVALWPVRYDARCAPESPQSLDARIERQLPRAMLAEARLRYVPVTVLRSLEAPGSQPDSVLSEANIAQRLEELGLEEALTVKLTCSGEGKVPGRTLEVRLNRWVRLVSLLKTSPLGRRNQERWFKTLEDEGRLPVVVPLNGLGDRDLKQALEKALEQLLGYPEVRFDGEPRDFTAGYPVRLPFSITAHKSSQSATSQYEPLVQVWPLSFSRARAVCPRPEESVPQLSKDGPERPLPPDQVHKEDGQIEFRSEKDGGWYVVQLKLHAKNPAALSSRPRYRCVYAEVRYNTGAGAVEVQLLAGRAFLPGAARGVLGATVLGTWSTFLRRLDNWWTPDPTIGVGLGFVYVGTADPLKAYEVDVRVQFSLDWENLSLGLLTVNPRLYFTGSMGLQHVAGPLELTADGLMGSAGVGLGIRGRLWRLHRQLRIGVSALAQYRSRFAALSGASSADLAAAGVPAGVWSLALVLDSDVVFLNF